MNHLDKEKSDATSVPALPAKEKKNKNNVKELKPLSESSEGTGSTGTPPDKFTEKQLRKLEWEKKLAEEKLNKETANAEDGTSKAALRAKRREQQQAQRLAKLEKSKEGGSKSSVTVKEPRPTQSQNNAKSRQTPPKAQLSGTTNDSKKSPIKKLPELKKLVTKQVQLVKHLYRTPNPEFVSKAVNFRDVPPVFVRLGVQYSEKVILGSNARSLALLAALKTLINDIQTPPKQELCRYLETVLQICTDYIQDCRPMAVSMTNALKAFKLHLRSINTALSDNQKRAALLECVEIYISNDIMKAWDAICLKVNEKIVNGDVILTYGSSSLIRKILFEAHKDGKKFSVIIVDSRPLLEGREMLRRLICAGIKCSYVLINGLSCVMKQSTKVLLGAHALLANGSVMSRIGTAQIALVAQAYNKPVLVCCERYKFSERVQTDSFVYNEIGNPDRLLSIDTSSTPSCLGTQKENPKLNILNLLYDVTPPDLVTAVVTELAVLPCTSVPVVLRINAGDNAI